MKKSILLLTLLTSFASFGHNTGTENLPELVLSLIQKANQGDVKSQYRLGLIYFNFNSEGVEQDYKESLYWFKKAADQKHAGAQYHIGLMYRKGLGVEQDLNTGFNWLKKSANQGHTESAYYLGDIYFEGKDVNRSFKNFFYWTERAASQGHAEAQNTIAVYYVYGILGVEKNLDKAVDLYRKAASQGHIGARDALYMIDKYPHLFY